ncbi:MAG: glycosyltransferase family 4 protein [Sphingomonas sp.]|nr:glycosyltransferase family 4 protein [Sphingomonas sp.]
MNRFYYPDHSATAQILTDLAEALVAAGWQVEVVTSRLHYEDAAVRFDSRSARAGVTIHRVATTAFGRAGIVGRLVDYLSFYFSAFFVLFAIVRRGDLIIAKTDPPLLSVIALLVARLRRARLVNWLQDLYPEVAAELGMAAMRGVVGSTLRWLRTVALRAAVANVAIGDRMAARLAKLGVPADRIAVIPNWADDAAIRPIPPAQALLRREWGLNSKFVVGYSGNLGRAHDSETLFRAALLLRDRPDIVFLMIGGGRKNVTLSKRVQASGLTNHFQFRPYQPREMLPQSLAVADVHWLSLLPALEGLVVPSKFYGIAAAGRPVIAVADPDGEIGRIVVREGCGVAIMPGDADGLAEVIRALADYPGRVAAMGKAARALIDRDYSRSLAIGRWKMLLERVVT